MVGIKIIKQGSKAVTTDGINGTITACTLKGNYIQYEFSYWNNGEYKFVWLTEHEFTTNKTNKIKIGYK